MSTEIKSELTGRVVEIDAADSDTAYVAIHGASMLLNANLPRADFLAAVAAECDAIVIPRTDLPHEWDGDDLKVGDWTREREWWLDERNVLFAKAILAGNEIAQNPPVDEAQVDALTLTIANVCHGDDCTASDLARRLVEAGVRVEAVRP